MGVVTFDHVSGTANYNANNNFEVLINGTLEPDADGDGYGDESQDNCTTVANDQSSNPCIGPPPPPPPPPGDPVLGRSFVVEPVNGQTFVKGGNGAFELLTRPRRLRIRSLVDTRAGTARIRTSRNRRGTLQSGDFFGGLFQVLQSRKRRARGLTELHLKGSSFSNCEAEASSRGARAFGSRRSRRVVRALGGNSRRALPDGRALQLGHRARHDLGHDRPLRRHAHLDHPGQGRRPRVPPQEDDHREGRQAGPPGHDPPHAGSRIAA